MPGNTLTNRRMPLEDRIAAGHELGTALRKSVEGEVLFDSYSRRIYSTDASIYSIEPLGVVCPRSPEDVVAAVCVARQFGVPVLPRGAGTSLAGQTTGRALVIDFSRFMHSLVEIDPGAGLARVQPGVVQDDLNRAAAPHRLFFAPDTSTANRATIGGMIGNNSCGARSARYGMTIDHIMALDVVLSDGSRAHFSPTVNVPQVAGDDNLAARLHSGVRRLVIDRADCIRRDMPAFWRRSGGYRLERMLPEAGPFSLANLVVGSEGTLAIVTEATVRLVEQPAAVVSVAGLFDNLEVAIEAARAAREAGASAIELIDRFILDLARQSAAHRDQVGAFSRAAAVLFVEFSAESAQAALSAAGAFEKKWRSQGYSTMLAGDAGGVKGFRDLRKAGLGLLTAAARGGKRSVAFVEDTAVDPDRLGDYTRRFAALLQRHGLEAGFYGHASAGCLHIRPFMDLSQPGQPELMREIAAEVLELVIEFGGMNSSEHGDGLVRSEFNRRFFGDELYETMVQLKRLFDPDGLLNPGKKVDAPLMTDNIRDVVTSAPLPVRDHNAVENLFDAANRCARIGECRKSAGAGGVMCPSYMVTLDERHSTRGRANALVHALSGPDPEAALSEDGLHEVLDLCLECKACRSECPMSVDMAALKAQALAARYRRRGTPLAAYLFGHVRTFNRLGCATAPLSNWLIRTRLLRSFSEVVTGIDRRRPLPAFSGRDLGNWFRRRRPGPTRSRRGTVVFLADCFTSYSEPGIGIAAIELLERSGWSVQLRDDLCCGRSLISKGLLDSAVRRQQRLVEQLAPAVEAGCTVAGVEPSCVFTITSDLLPHVHSDNRAAAVAARTRLADDLLADALSDGSLTAATESHAEAVKVLFHPHCHQRAASAVAGSRDILKAAGNVEVLDAGCCGMAGSFGFEKAHYDISLAIAQSRLFPSLSSQPTAVVAASGVSCRHQIRSAYRPARVVEAPVTLLAAALGR
ncbi:MAG: FAD-binding and (Fe-S)-binding domain-containing protein [Gemmatimonadota bacterium]